LAKVNPHIFLNEDFKDYSLETDLSEEVNNIIGFIYLSSNNSSTKLALMH